MKCLGTWFSSGHDDLKDLLQPKQFYNSTWMCKPLASGWTRDFLRPLPAWITPFPSVFMDKNERKLIGPTQWDCLGCFVDAQADLQDMKQICLHGLWQPHCVHIGVIALLHVAPKITSHLPAPVSAVLGGTVMFRMGENTNHYPDPAHQHT